MSDFEFIDPIAMWVRMRVNTRSKVRLVAGAMGLTRLPGETNGQLVARIVDRTKSIPAYRNAAEMAMAKDSEFGRR